MVNANYIGFNFPQFKVGYFEKNKKEPRKPKPNGVSCLTKKLIFLNYYKTFFQ